MLNKLDLSNYVVISSNNPDYYFELYDKVTLCFVCFYFHKYKEGKSLGKKSMQNMRRVLNGF
jgi:hypothetical protein